MRENRKACMLLVGMPEGKRPLRRPRYKWFVIIKMDLGKIRGVDWNVLLQDTN
jgi:hypothetical protein